MNAITETQREVLILVRDGRLNRLSHSCQLETARRLLKKGLIEKKNTFGSMTVHWFLTDAGVRALTEACE